jgi:hypothetical protein
MSVTFKDEALSIAPMAFAASAGAPSSLPQLCASRDQTLDCLRGLAIVWMTATHVAPQSKLTAILHLPLYLSAFEWFGLLSGFVLGMRAWHARQSSGIPRLLAWVRRRMLLLYCIHVLLVLIVIVVHEAFGVLHVPTMQELGGWPRTLLLIITLGFQPVDFMNILPLYIVLLLAAPLLIWTLNRRATWILVAPSSALWLIGLLNPDLLPFPGVSFGPRPFSLLAWQFIFILGLAAGYHRDRLLGIFWGVHKRKILAVAVAIALTIFVFAQLQRRPALGLGLQLPEHLYWLLDKKTFGPVRAVYTIASLILAAFAIRCLLAWSERARSRLGTSAGKLLSDLALMGRLSLACFVLHLGFALTAVGLKIAEQTQIVSEVALLLALVLLYGCMRYGSEWWRTAISAAPWHRFVSHRRSGPTTGVTPA